MESNKKYMKIWRNKNKVRIKVNRKRYYHANKKKENSYCKEYRLTHPEYFRDRWLKYYDKNKDWLLAHWRKKHKATRKQDSAREKERLHKDYNFKIAKYLRNSIRTAFKQYYKNKIIWNFSKYPIDYKGIVLHLFKVRPKDYDENPSKYEIDHIKPLCSFKLDNEESIKIAFAPTNHQWLMPKQNYIKARDDRKKSKWD